jgi:hypothetical protein
LVRQSELRLGMCLRIDHEARAPWGLECYTSPLGNLPTR